MARFAVNHLQIEPRNEKVQECFNFGGLNAASRPDRIERLFGPRPLGQDTNQSSGGNVRLDAHMVGHEQANSLQQESLKRLWIAGDGHCSHFELGPLAAARQGPFYCRTIEIKLCQQTGMFCQFRWMLWRSCAF